MDEFKDAAIEGQGLLRYPPMRSDPRAQPRPKAFDRLDVHFMNAVTLGIACLLAGAMTNGLVRLAPFLATSLDGICIGADARAPWDWSVEEWSHGGLWAIGQQRHGDIATAWPHAEDRWLRSRQGPASTCPVATVSSSCSPFVCTASGWPVCPASR